LPPQPLVPLFALSGLEHATSGFLSQASKHLTVLWSYSQHRLDEKATSAFVAALSHSADLATMRKIDVGGILHQQHHGRGSGLFPGLLKVGLHQGSKADIWLDPRKRHNALVSFQVCI